MKTLSLLLTANLVLLGFDSARAKDVVLKSEAERDEVIRRGEVWTAPPWISQDFKFSDSLDLIRGPEVSGLDQLLMADSIHCQTNEELATDYGPTGKTPKLYCELMTLDKVTGKYVVASGKGAKIKVKYHPDEKRLNGEVFGEILGTRLLWALGFPTDRMFFIDKVFCHGCSKDPFKDRVFDPSTLKMPRLFRSAAIERKAKGDELIIEKERPVIEYSRNGSPVSPKTIKSEVLGWGFDELMETVSNDPEEARRQKVQRGSLGLLGAFIQHVDNKEENQRINCVDGADDSGACKGPVHLMIQDLGATFGRGFSIGEMNIVKADLVGWRRKSIWLAARPGLCRANIGFWFETSMRNPHVSEESRQFLLRLLDGFSRGPDGRKRVLDLFRAAHIERRGGTPEEWAEVFFKKLEEIRYPQGPENPAFKCPPME